MCAVRFIASASACETCCWRTAATSGSPRRSPLITAARPYDALSAILHGRLQAAPEVAAIELLPGPAQLAARRQQEKGDGDVDGVGVERPQRIGVKAFERGRECAKESGHGSGSVYRRACELESGPCTLEHV